MKITSVLVSILCCLLVGCANQSPTVAESLPTDRPSKMFARVTAYRMGGKRPEKYRGKLDWDSFKGRRGDGGQLTVFDPARDQIGSCATDAVPPGWLVIISDEKGYLKYFIANDVPGRAVLSRDAAIALAEKEGRSKEHPYSEAKVIDCCTPGGKEPTSHWATVTILPYQSERPYHELSLREKVQVSKLSSWRPALQKAGFYK